jgi:hypothetical protein
MFRVIRLRTLVEDFRSGKGEKENYIEGCEAVMKARKYKDAEKLPVPKDELKKAKAMPKGTEEEKAERTAKIREIRNRINETNDINEEIEIAKFVCEELDKFSTDVMQKKVEESERIYAKGLNGVRNAEKSEIAEAIREAKALPATTKEEKEIRKNAIEIAKSRKSAFKAVKKYFTAEEDFSQPDFAILEKFFDIEDECEEKLKPLYEEKRLAKKQKDTAKVKQLAQEIKKVESERNEARRNSKAEMDKHAFFNRAAKPYLDADKLLKQKENYKHLDDISSHYEEAKARYEKELAEKAAEAARKAAEEKAYEERIKAEKAAAKAKK